MAASITPILKTSRQNRGKRLIAYQTGPGPRQNDVYSGAMMASEDDLQQYARKLRPSERNGRGLVYIVPAPNRGALALRGHSPLAPDVVSPSSSDETTPRSPRLRSSIRTTAETQLPGTEATERASHSVAHLPPGAVLLSQLDLAQRPQQQQQLDGRQLTYQNAHPAALMPGSQGFVLQPYRQNSQAEASRVAAVSAAAPSHHPMQYPVKNGVHFEGERPVRSHAVAGASSNQLYDDMNRTDIGGSCGDSDSVNGSFRRRLFWKRYYSSHTTSNMIICLRVVFHIISMLLSIVAITLSVMVATGYISTPRNLEAPGSTSNDMLETSWRNADAAPFRTGPGGGGLNNGIRAHQDNFLQQPQQQNRVARIGVLWQKLEDMGKTANANRQTMRSAGFLQDKITAQLRRLEAMIKSRSSHDATDLLSTSYTHWGRRTCAPSAEHNGTVNMAYSGVVGGSADSQPGNGANALCMPMQPTWGSFSSDMNSGGRLYGATYRLGVLTEGVYNVFDGNASPGRLNRRPIPCTVCRVRRATTILRLPATTQCPPGFRRLYDGYLLSAAATQFKSQYLCVDKFAEDADFQLPAAMQASTPQMSLFPVESQCGSMPCQQYPARRELTCVVCVA